MKKIIHFPKSDVQTDSVEPSTYHCFDDKLEETKFFNELRNYCRKERGYDFWLLLI